MGKLNPETETNCRARIVALQLHYAAALVEDAHRAVSADVTAAGRGSRRALPGLLEAISCINDTVLLYSPCGPIIHIARIFFLSIFY
jgi:hypothetical protein